MTAPRGISECGRAALTSLDCVLDEGGDKGSEELGEAVRRIARLRDEIIARRRAAGPSPELDASLERANAIVSCVVGAEFPVQGLHSERIAAARDALRELLEAAV